MAAPDPAAGDLDTEGAQGSGVFLHLRVSRVAGCQVGFHAGFAVVLAWVRQRYFPPTIVCALFMHSSPLFVAASQRRQFGRIRGIQDLLAWKE
jgi:hypothetical protein